jgi:hypothetical protein
MSGNMVSAEGGPFLPPPIRRSSSSKFFGIPLFLGRVTEGVTNLAILEGVGPGFRVPNSMCFDPTCKEKAERR